MSIDFDRSINKDTCNICGLCVEVCPIKLIVKAKDGITFRPDRIQFCIGCGQCMAVCPSQSIFVEGLSYDRDFYELPKQAESAGSFFDLIASRRAIRNFKDQPVPKELLEKIVQAISLAPPGFTPIKTEVVVVQDPEVIAQALPYMIQVYAGLIKSMHNPIARMVIRRKVGEAKFKTIKSHVIPLMENRLPELQRGEEDTITRRAPAMIVFHADKQAENFEADIYIALTYGFLAAHALGLGATAIDLIPPAIQNNKDLRQMFAIPEENVVVGAMIVGYPKYRYQRGIKRDLKRVVWMEKKL